MVSVFLGSTLAEPRSRAGEVRLANVRLPVQGIRTWGAGAPSKSIRRPVISFGGKAVPWRGREIQRLLLNYKVTLPSSIYRLFSCPELNNKMCSPSENAAVKYLYRSSIAPQLSPRDVLEGEAAGLLSCHPQSSSRDPQS